MNQNKPKIIGLTGGIGSGKTTIANYFKKGGAYVIEADKIGHKVILKGNDTYFKIINFFGTQILDNTTKQIDRKKLAKIVFSNKEKLKVLNQITHKPIENEILKEVKKANEKNMKLILIEMAILIEAGFKHLVDEVWLVYAPHNKRIERTIKRDKISTQMAENIIKNQGNQEELKKQADKVIINDELEKTKDFIEQFLKNNVWE